MNDESVAVEAEIAALPDVLDRLWTTFDARPARPDDPEWFGAFAELLRFCEDSWRDIVIDAMKRGVAVDFESIREVVTRIDARDRRRLEGWLRSRTWPRISEFGASACEHVFYVAVHADGDVVFLERVLAEMATLLPAGEVSTVHYAAIHDRVAINREKPSLFGMFYRLNNGVRVPYPVDDPALVQARREALGLGEICFQR